MARPRTSTRPENKTHFQFSSRQPPYYLSGDRSGPASLDCTGGFCGVIVVIGISGGANFCGAGAVARISGCASGGGGVSPVLVCACAGETEVRLSRLRDKMPGFGSAFMVAAGADVSAT